MPRPHGFCVLRELRVPICDGASNLGEMEIIANEGQVCRIPLLAGAEYTIESTEGIGDVSASDDDAEVEEIEVGRKYGANLPLDFSFSSGGSGYYYLETSPLDVGARFHTVTGGCCAVSASATELQFSCSGDCGCAKGRAKASDAPVLANIAWEGFVKRIDVDLLCRCLAEAEMKRGEINQRGATILILDSQGAPIPWAEPILVGESVIIEVRVGGEAMSKSDFIDLFEGQLRLDAHSFDFDGRHEIADEPAPLEENNVIDMGGNAFQIFVDEEWLSENGLLSDADDSLFSKASIDISDGYGASSRADGDAFDVGADGTLHGRARGTGGGKPYARIPEGAFNRKTVQSAGTASLVAYAASITSEAQQCQQQADVLYYSGHGNHDAATLNGSVGPSDVAGRWHDVDTAVFAGCSILDVDDIATRVDGNAASPLASPGRKWLAASGANVLLGYCWYAPLDSKGGIDVANKWLSLRKSKGDIDAWMEANDETRGRNACAIRRIDDGRFEYFYYERETRLLPPFRVYHRRSVILEATE